MADISGYLKNIREASRGEDVRDTIIKALDTINRDNPITLEPLNVTANGTYGASAGRGYSRVTVQVPEGATNSITLNDTKITENGTFKPDEGEAFSSVVVEVPQYVNEIMQETKEIVYEGDQTYVALRDGYDGYSAIHIIDPTSGGPGGGGATFTVTFQMPDGTHIQTKTGVPFGGGATVDGPLPTSPGMRFVGWNPNPINVKTNMVCKAVFKDLTWFPNEITDDWATIAKKCNDDPDAYQIGQFKGMEIGAAGDRYSYIRFQLVGKRCDEMEGGVGYANTSWLAMDQLNYSKSMVRDSSQPNDGIRWEISGMRVEVMQGWVTQHFPQEVLPYIKRVIKYSSSNKNDVVQRDYATVDWFWIPSMKELGIQTYSDTGDGDVEKGNTYVYETKGPTYDCFAYNSQTMSSSLVNSEDACANRHRNVYGTPANNTYLSRTYRGGMNFHFVNSDGEIDWTHVNNEKYILFGFCL